MHAGSGRTASGTHPIDEFLEVGQISAADIDHHVDISDDVPGGNHVNLVGEKPLEVVEAKPWEAHKHDRLHAG